MKHFRMFKAAVGVLVVMALLGEAASAADKVPAGATLVYVGTYTRGASKGIYAFRLEVENPQTSHSTLAPLGLAAEIPSPSFLAVDPKRRLLFAVNEVNQFQAKQGGGVSAFAIDRESGMLTPLNQQPSMGTGPCHLVLDKTGRNVLVANYGSGSVAVLPVGEDGRLGEPTSVMQHRGKSVNPQRQEGPHAHAVILDASNQFAFVCDLGLDKVMIYRFDAAAGKLTPNVPPSAELKPGSGPRHMIFRPDGRFAYVNNEMTSTVTAFAYDANAGALRELQTISTLPAGFDGRNSTAEIDVHPSGKFLYVSNRGHDSVALFNVDQEKGTLTFVEAQATGGKTPRHFGIDPSGTHMAVSNQGTNQVTVWRIDGENGRLKPSGVFAEVGSPVCAVFVPAVEAAGEKQK